MTFNQHFTFLIFIFAIATCNGQSNQNSENFTYLKKIPIENFFRKPLFSGYSLSPNGKYLIYRSPVNSVNNIFLQEIGKDDPVQLTHFTDRDIMRFFWGNNDIVIYMQDNEGDENWKLYTINIKTLENRCLTDFENCNTEISSFFAKDSARIIVEINKRDPECYDVYYLNIYSGELQMIEQNPGNVRSWGIDNNGVVRIAYSDKVLYRKNKHDDFKELNLNKEPDDEFTIKYFTSDNNNVYAYSNIGRDKIAIVEYNLEENREVSVLFEDPDYDAFGDDEKDYFKYSYTRNKLMYAQHTTEKRELHFFDKELENIYKKIKAKIGDYEIQFVSIADDYGTILFYKYSDRLEGTSYIYDSKYDKLELLGNSTPYIDEKDMAQMKPIEYSSRDGLKIHGYLTIPNGVNPISIPVIVFPHAGPEWRNSWGFDEFVQFFANRGYAVLQVNFRGSEGYGKEFLQAGFRQRGLKMQDDITDGVNWLIDNGIADKDRIAIFGISYGGYAALVGLTLTPELYACGIDFWGVSNWFLWYESFPPQWKRYLNEIHRRWINPSTDSLQMHQSSPVFHVKNIKAPVFIGQSVNDRRVVYQHSEQMVEELKKYNKEYEYVLLEGEGHALTNEKKLIELMSRVEIFLDKHMNKRASMNNYLNQTPPIDEPEIFAPDIVSTAENFELASTWSPDGNEFYFSRRIDGKDYIMVTKYLENGWTKPEVASFYKEYGGFEPHISLDGTKMFINLFKPPPFEVKDFDKLSPGDQEACMVNIWSLTKVNDEWKDPQFVANGMYSSTSKNKNLYTTDIGENGKGVVKYKYENGKYRGMEVLGGGVNYPKIGAHPCISPDESFIIFDSNRKDNPEDADLYVCFKNDDGNWSEAYNLGDEVNTRWNDICPTLSPDGKYLFYMSKGDIYWVSAKIIDERKPKDL